ncbi:MAG: hypothetical protein WBW80_06695 [Acidimicrobiales bacterium]
MGTDDMGEGAALASTGRGLTGPSNTAEGPNNTAEGPNNTAEGPSNTAEGPNNTAEVGEQENDPDGAHLPLREALAARVLQVGTLRLETKLLLGAVVAQLIVAAILVSVRNAQLPTIQSDNFAHTTATMPILVFVACVVFSSAAWGLILAGAFRAGWEVRVTVVGFFLWAMLSEHDVLDQVSAPAVFVCCLLLAAVVATAVATWFPESAGAHRDVPNGEPSGRWRIRRRLLPPLLVLAVAAIYLTAWSANQSAGHVDVFSDDMADQLAGIQYILIPVLVLAGSEFGSWSDFVAHRVVLRIRSLTREWLFGGIVVIAAGAILWNGLRASMPNNGGDVAPELLLAAVVAVVVAVLYLAAKPRDKWPGNVSLVALAAAAAADSTVGYIAERQLAHSDPLLIDKVYGVSATFWIVSAVVALLALVILRGRLPGPWVAAGCLVVLVGAVDGLTELDDIGVVVHPFGLTSSGRAGHLVTNAPNLGIEGLKSVAAMAVIAVVVYALATGAMHRLIVPVSLLITLTVSLELLTWIDLLFGKTSDTTGRVALFAGVVLVVALVWELASSGEGLTNLHSRQFPRESRVMLYGAYILLVSAAVLFFSSLHDAESTTLLESQFDAEQWVREGILFLGVPLVITLFLVGMQRWRRRSPLVGHHPGTDLGRGKLPDLE